MVQSSLFDDQTKLMFLLSVIAIISNFMLRTYTGETADYRIPQSRSEFDSEEIRVELPSVRALSAKFSDSGGSSQSSFKKVCSLSTRGLSTNQKDHLRKKSTTVNID